MLGGPAAVEDDDGAVAAGLGNVAAEVAAKELDVGHGCGGSVSG